MFDLVDHTDTRRLCPVVINMKGLLWRVHVLTQPAGHPFSETAGCCGVDGQPKVLTDGMFVHQHHSFSLWPHMSFKLSDIIFSHFESPNVGVPVTIVLSCAIYLNVQMLTTHPDMFICMCIILQACVCLTLRSREPEGGGVGGESGCGERSAQRLSSGRWCDTEAG